MRGSSVSWHFVNIYISWLKHIYNNSFSEDVVMYTTKHQNTESLSFLCFAFYAGFNIPFKTAQTDE